ncbi:L,D-transpeptidase family protein [Fulvivirgaceae bacterium BMA12]|uniref:L,D-transpeptidase family protein n=1 Tax=Agaribacillus aureus TaxID=3051825 RepID=A0ABT8L8F9_9BACT|nr:L,D-transpeptidase family protein [Fulvivirgaceae bacterium BMA12]
MINISIFLSLLLLMVIPQDNNDFKNRQLKYTRVKSAYAEKRQTIKSLLSTKGISDDKFLLFIRIFKKEEVMEVWVKGSHHHRYQHLKDYKFCANSGRLGPKRKSGDRQIPEGFYFIDRFNPVSNFHLSLGINYPNRSDKTLGHKENPGGDIFLHGGCATIGCVPITDDKIKGLYILAVEAKNNGQNKIPVHIFPGRAIKEAQWRKLSASADDGLVHFWKNLKPGYDHFEKNRQIPGIKVKQNGDYYMAE